MKSERGLTITSVIIYVVALTIAVIVVGRLMTYFYKNLNFVKGSAISDAEYMKFNSFFTDEVNIEGNKVEQCGNEGDIEYIIFSKSQNQYTFKNGRIYKNKVKICDDVDQCDFEYDESTEIISVTLKIQNKEYNTKYIIVK